MGLRESIDMGKKVPIEYPDIWWDWYPVEPVNVEVSDPFD